MRKLSTDLIKSGSFTGSFSGSVIGTITSASFASTASYLLNSFSLNTGSSYPITSSWSNNSISSSFSNTSISSSYSLTSSNLSPVAQDLIPTSNSLYSLGSPTNKWKDLYVSTGSIYIGNVVLSTSGSTLYADVQPIVTLNTASGQIEISGMSASLSASYSNTSSIALNAISSSYSLSGSYVKNADISQTSTSASYSNTSSVALNAISSSYGLTSSYSLFANDANNSSTSTSASYSSTASVALNALTSSYINVATNAVSSSYASTASISVSSSFATTAGTATSATSANSANTATSASYSLSSSFATVSTTATSATSASYALTSSFALSGVAGNEGGGLFTVTSDGFNYNIIGYSGSFPTITLVRNQLYYFNVSGVSASHPFALRLSSGNTSAVPGTTNNDPVNGLANTNTLIIYRVPNDAPSSIVYQCVVHSSMIGTINIVNQYDNALTTGSTYPITASWAINALSASYAPGGGGTSLTTGSTYPITSSWSNYSFSSSYSLTASYALNAGSGGGSSSTSSLIGQTFVPTASVSQLSLTQSVSDNDQILVILDGLVQSRTGSYTVSGSTLTLTENADSGSIIDIRFLAGSSSGGSSVSSSYALTSSFSTTIAPRTAIYRYGTTSVVNPGSYAYTIIKYDTAVTDSTGWYDNTNGRFTPTVSGWYQVSAGARVYSSGTSEGYLTLLKNGTELGSNGGFGTVNGFLSMLVYFNGSTDYLQLYSRTQNAITNAQNSSNAPFTMVYMTS
jgi:hypothetical protein